jgi:hypothetical protein
MLRYLHVSMYFYMYTNIRTHTYKLVNICKYTYMRIYIYMNIIITSATFEADLLMPGVKLPNVELPSFEDLRFAPPNDFDSPFDMKSYPQLFDPAFVEYFFQSEVSIYVYIYTYMYLYKYICMYV